MSTQIGHAVEGIANKTTLGGATAGAIGYLANVNWIGLLGTLVAIGGFAVSFWFQWRRDKRENEMHRAQLDAIKRRRSDG